MATMWTETVQLNVAIPRELVERLESLCERRALLMQVGESQASKMYRSLGLTEAAVAQSA
ncbi:MAG: hypothetical protein KF847_19790 [Pirellulales bacterium]|nr:hypothetical protein [Pirellulales bacterium]